ncbi:hypothetical protein AX16_004093 [Volvariella volvacea WC 439]|nr:hypothetical protein AX16_004093 [Volvariella volvacea WC 439]
MLVAFSSRGSTWRTASTVFYKAPRAHSLQSRSYAISVQPPKPLPGKQLPRVFRDKKAFQYNWYTRILQTNTTSPILFLHHEEFSAGRLVKLRKDIKFAYKPKPSLNSPTPVPPPSPTPSLSPVDNPGEPQLTIIRTSIFGAALRDLPGINIDQVDKLFANQSGNFAVLTLPSLDPPQLSAILRAMERGVPARPPKTEEDLKREKEEKNADPATPGRRMKRSRAILHPQLKVVGGLIEGKVFLPQGVQDVAKYPTLDTLRAQIVGLLSSPGMQIAGVLSQAGGARLARTLEGLKKSLEEEANGGAPAA